MRAFPQHFKQEGEYIYVMYMYDCNAILSTSMNNRSDKEMIRDFTNLTEYLKIWGIHPGLHFIYNDASTTLNMTMMTMNIKY